MLTKTRKEKVAAQHGGEECPGVDTIEESCNVQECPGNQTILQIEYIHKALYINKRDFPPK